MPFPTLGNLGPGLMPNYNDQPTLQELLRLQQQMLQNRALAGSGMPVYVAPNLDRNVGKPDQQMLYDWFRSQGLLQERP